MTFTPTEEQQLIVAFMKGKSANLLVDALAGATKTSTLVLASNASLVPTLAVAFNKRIADEMGKRLPGHVKSQTMNSVGHASWGQATGKRLVVNTSKTFDNVNAYIDSVPQSRRKELREIFAGLMRAVRLAKSNGYVPQKAHSMGTSLIHEGTFEDSLIRDLDCDVDEMLLEAVDAILMRSIAESYSGLIDFDDQIYMSTLFGGSFPQYPLLMVDEAQDLSPLNHATIKKLYGGRLLAVGDPNQAIYAFRGAHTSSMSILKETFQMETLPLTISMRCPRAVVRYVQGRVPHMRWPDWAEEGHVETLHSWNAATIPDGSAIICRNNAPLFACGMALIRAGRGVHIIGNDIGAGLVKLMKKIAPATLPSEEFRNAITAWKTAELRRQPEARHAAIQDKAECLLVFCEFGNDSFEAYKYAEHLFNQAGPIQLMTGHKAKGLEFDTVYHLNPYLVPSKWAVRAAEEGDDSQLQQELNLQYVIHTRAKRELYLIDLEEME
jgi:DNA helicase-2/ATP-dependent DNA helicase PcrA